MKSDRLLSILLLLQTRGRVPAAELAERLEVSVRTIYRDVASLSTAGVPVYAERGRHGGIALLPGFRTDVTGLTSDEARALFVLAAQGAHSALGLEGALGSALRKIMAALPPPHRPAAELTSRRILVDPERWQLGHAGRERRDRPVVDLDVLHTAVFADRRLRMRYRHGGDSEPQTYTVDPYGLVAKAGVWYLVADLRGGPRLFRADRVASARVLDTPVQRRAGIELAEAWEALRDAVEVRPTVVRVHARVRRERLALFLRICGTMLDPGSPPPDGTGREEWAEVRMAYPAFGAVCQLLQFGGDVEVLDPPAARAELLRAAREITALYPPPPNPDPDPDPDTP
ncbi:WYL domain-containing protein [Streptomyces sp. DSM 42041]|uniref:WYL domain-containing protein n=1 Tax=Streptomyces hazeniae TaxID=3075538 RepID=A0ABU2NLN9_9ACTN|nr:WYL domain-containing protein [Streptomyces sp. DSM 42041]MDT0377895.1 WYL domain-containing protein [Streptomyces sp. DSM 42041]